MDIIIIGRIKKNQNISFKKDNLEKMKRNRGEKC